jgi:cation:H+ antiporter
MALFVMICFDHNVSRADGLVLLVLFVVFVLMTIRDALNNRTEADEEFEVLSPLRSVIYIVGGIAAIVCGGNLVVDSACDIAASFGLSQTLIGLTVVAFGTSLPELVTSIIASRKGENGLALGNVIGSNIFNILMVLATSAVVKPIPVSIDSVIDAACFIVFSLIVLIWCKTSHKLTRLEGIGMLAIYAAYTVYICIR